VSDAPIGPGSEAVNAGGTPAASGAVARRFDSGSVVGDGEGDPDADQAGSAAPTPDRLDLEAEADADADGGAPGDDGGAPEDAVGTRANDDPAAPDAAVRSPGTREGWQPTIDTLASQAPARAGAAHCRRGAITIRSGNAPDRFLAHEPRCAGRSNAPSCEPQRDVQEHRRRRFR
jgi:hypothetical protein